MNTEEYYKKNNYYYKYKCDKTKKLDDILEPNENMTPSIIVIDNFYKNPIEVREFALSCNLKRTGNFPGVRTERFVTDKIKTKIQEILSPYGQITKFNMYNESFINDNGCFQFTTSQNHSWIHKDNCNTNWAGIIYLTPDAPLNSGTNFYKFKNETNETNETNEYVRDFNRDLSKWEIIDKIGNEFNRLILFNSNRFHMSGDYFGINNENGRLTQVFFFSTNSYTS